MRDDSLKPPQISHSLPLDEDPDLMREDSLPKPPQIPPSLPLDENPSNPKRFILQEAEEKANEISISVEETEALIIQVIVFSGWQEFNVEKLQLVEKKKIRQEYERKEKQVEVRKKL